jgi:hypothetical protein
MGKVIVLTAISEKAIELSILRQELVSSRVQSERSKAHSTHANAMTEERK